MFACTFHFLGRYTFRGFALATVVVLARSLVMSGTLSKLESWISSETAKKGNKVKLQQPPPSEPPAGGSQPSSNGAAKPKPSTQSVAPPGLGYVLHSRDALLDAIASKSLDALSGKLLKWTGQSTFIDFECFHTLAYELLGEKASAEAVDSMFQQCQEMSEGDDGRLLLAELHRRARHETQETRLQHLTLRAGNAFGNRQLQKFETNYRVMTDRHVRTHARIVVGERADEEVQLRRYITAHRNLERSRMRDRTARTVDTYERLRLPRQGDPRVQPPLRSSISMGSLASQPRRTSVGYTNPDAPGTLRLQASYRTAAMHAGAAVLPPLEKRRDEINLLPPLSRRRDESNMLPSKQLNGGDSPAASWPQMESSVGFTEVGPLRRSTSHVQAEPLTVSSREAAKPWPAIDLVSEQYLASSRQVYDSRGPTDAGLAGRALFIRR